MPDKFDEKKFVELLTTDLIIYILREFLETVSDKGEIISSIINKWSDKVDEDAYAVKTRYVKTITAAGEKDMTEDVAMILLDITNINKTIIKKEFKEKILKNLLKYVK